MKSELGVNESSRVHARYMFVQAAVFFFFLQTTIAVYDNVLQSGPNNDVI